MPSVTTLPCNPDKYSADCIAQVAYAAGFKTEDKLSTAVAIALAESSGRTKVVNSIGCCVGLWQINVKVHSYTKEQMQNPQQNAAAAYKISKQGTTWKPWTVYNTGVYLVYKPTANAAAKKIVNNGGASPSIAGDIIDDYSDDIDDLYDNTVGAFMEPIVAVKEWISNRDNIFRIIKVISGVVVAVAGINMLVKQPIQTAIKEIKQ